MKIIYFVQYFPPEKAAGLPMVEDLLEGFANSGWDIKVYTPTPTRGVSIEERIEYSKKKKEETRHDSRVIIHRMALYREGERFVFRALRYAVFSLECLWKGFTEPGEIIFTGSGPPTQGVIGGIIRKFTKKKFIYNLQDIFPDSLANTGITTEESFIWKIGRKLEDFTYRQADNIVVISEDFKKNIMKKGVPAEKITVIPNWVNTENIYPIPREKNKLIKKYQLELNKFYICYSGNIGYTQNMNLLVDVAEEVGECMPDVAFIVIGDGVAKEELAKTIEKKKINNIILLPYQKYEDIAHVFSLGNIGLVISKAGVGGNSIPSKTWDILAAGRPVLSSFDEGSELTRIINEIGCGIAVPSDDKEKLINAIKKLHDNPEFVKKCSQRGLRYLQECLDRKKCVANYIDVANKIL